MFVAPICLFCIVQVSRVKVLTRVLMLVAVSVLTVQADRPSVGNGPVKGSNLESKPVIRVAATNRIEQKVEKSLFSEPTVAPWSVLEGYSNGFVALRVERLLKHPLLGTFAQQFFSPVIDSFWQGVVKNEFAGRREMFGLYLGNVDHATLEINFSMSKKEGLPGAKNSSLGIGSKAGSVHFNQPLDHKKLREAVSVDRLVSLIQPLVGRQGNDIGGQSVDDYVVGILDAMFDQSSASHDLSLMSTSPPDIDPASMAAIQTGWRLVDGGTAVAAFVLPETLGFLEDEKDRQIDAVFSRAVAVAIGLDFHQAGPAQVKVVFVPRMNIAVEQVKQDVTHLIQYFEQKLVALDNPEQGVTKVALAMSKSTLGSREITIVEQSEACDRECLMLNLQFPLDMLPSLLLQK